MCLNGGRWYMPKVTMPPVPVPAPGAGGALLGAATREALAFVKLALLMPRDVGLSVPAGAVAGHDVVVFVHGTLATAGAWRPLRQRLELDSGIHTAGFTYGPASGAEGVARSLASLVAALPAGVRIHLVGHSLGGLAVRWYVQSGPRDPRVVQTIAVAAPFGGARGARLLPGPAGRDMRRGSAVLTWLAATAQAPALPHLSVFGTADTAVDSETSFPVGERLIVPGAGHNGLLFHPFVADSVVERVLAARR
jgi:triacylglycerol lipase